MITITRAAERHRADLGWLQSLPLYSFGGFQDDSRMGFGMMKVCNDDTLAPGTGFGAHPHSDMEIVSIILEGAIRHEDNLGNRVVSRFGEIQRMSAGTGIIHAEFNDSEEESLRLLQLWFTPRQRGLAPEYEAIAYPVDQLDGQLLPVVCTEPQVGAARVQQDVTVYLSKLSAGEALTHPTSPDRRLLLYVIEGAVGVEGEALHPLDTAELESLEQLSLQANEASFLMLIDMASGEVTQ